MNISITDVKIRKIIENGKRMKAIVSITIDNCLAIHDIKIVQGDSRLFVAMPSRKDENGIFRDVVHPVDEFTRDRIENAILNEYTRYMESNEE